MAINLPYKIDNRYLNLVIFALTHDTDDVMVVRLKSGLEICFDLSSGDVLTVGDRRISARPEWSRDAVLQLRADMKSLSTKSAGELLKSDNPYDRIDALLLVSQLGMKQLRGDVEKLLDDPAYYDQAGNRVFYVRDMAGSVLRYLDQ